MPASYFLGTRLLGSSPANPRWDDDRDLFFEHQALFCPMCGEVWARILIDGANGWRVAVRHCAKEYRKPGNWDSDSSGSFIASWRRTFSELPPEVLEYEAKLRLERFDNEQS